MSHACSFSFAGHTTAGEGRKRQKDLKCSSLERSSSLSLSCCIVLQIWSLLFLWMKTGQSGTNLEKQNPLRLSVKVTMFGFFFKEHHVKIVCLIAYVFVTQKN